MIYYIRDEEGSLIGFKYNNTMYYYLKNLQEDIIGITDSNFNKIVSYEYDPWGKIISIKDNNNKEITNSSHIGIINPFKYRSYYYDNETKLYYLNSRYYNPVWGRFLNVDEITGEIGNIMSHNMYMYAYNNPTNYDDTNGNVPKWIKKVLIGAAIIGAGAIMVAATGGVGALAATTAFVKGAIVTSVKIGAVAAGTKAATAAIKSASKKEDIKTTAKNVGNAALDGFGNGFLTGSVVSGISAISTIGNHSNGIKIGETDKPQYGRITVGYGSDNGGMTIINVANREGKSRFRIDADPKNMIYVHHGLTNSQLKKHRKTIIDIIFGVISGG